MEKLKPCPFCGGEAETSEGRSGWYVYCEDCPCESVEMSGAEDWAVDKWNTRPIEDAQAAKIAQLEKALELACHDVCDGIECDEDLKNCPALQWSEAPCSNDCVNTISGNGLTAHYMQKAKEATNG